MESYPRGETQPDLLSDNISEVREALRTELVAAVEQIRRYVREEVDRDNHSHEDGTGKESPSPAAPEVSLGEVTSMYDVVRTELAVALQQICCAVSEELNRDSDDEDGNDDEEDSEPRCPDGHPLRAALTPNDTYCCDMCKTSVPKGTMLFGCRRCNYDVCQSCSGKTADLPVRARASPGSTPDESDDSWGESDEEAPPAEQRKLVICVRCDLGMSLGKAAAQVGHAVHSAVRRSPWRDLQAWEARGAKKVTLKVDSLDELLEIKRAARGAGLVAESIRDAGHTELEPGTMTVLAVGPAPALKVDPVTGHLRTVPDNLKRENEKLKAQNARIQADLDSVRQEKKQMRKDKLRLLQLLSINKHCM